MGYIPTGDAAHGNATAPNTETEGGFAVSAARARAAVSAIEASYKVEASGRLRRGGVVE